MKGCLRFSTFIFWILPNSAKSTYKWNFFEKIISRHKFFFLNKKKTKRPNFLVAKNCHNYLWYKRVLKIFYFDIFNIAKYLAKYTFIWSPLEQPHEIFKKTQTHTSLNARSAILRAFFFHIYNNITYLFFPRMYFSINSNFQASKLGLFVILFLRLSSYSQH
jgi:hypothetical protein